MKKYLMTAAAALTFGGLMTSCTKDLDSGGSSSGLSDNPLQNYEQAFLNTFGRPVDGFDWGFGSGNNSTAASTRAMTIGEDVYNEFNLPTTAEHLAAYPTAIPEGAEEVSELASMEKYKTQEYNNGNLFFIYSKNGGGHNYKITSSGEVTIGGSWKNESNQIYNVYVSVNGNVTLKRNGTEFMNLYILSGNVTLDSSFGECGGLISVASGATLNDARDHIAHNGGIKLFNRGTVNATNSSYMIGNNAYIYNQGTFDVNGHLNYNAGSGNPPYFFNVGDDVLLTADSFTLNSNGGFISDGTVNISGSTQVTQAGIIWVNNGHYTTGSLNFSAKNATFYNYCQLKVTGNTLFTDGEFNLMSNSYMETQHGLFNNFIINMYDNSGVNITDGIMTGRQGDGTFQGFRAVDNNARAYVRIAGTSYIPVQQEGALRVYGANMTFAYNEMKFYENTNGINIYSTWNTGNYWGETNQAALDAKQDPRIEWNKNNVTKIFTGDDFSKISVTSNSRDCAATWTVPGTPVTPPVTPVTDKVRVIAEDLSTLDGKADFDFNDVVFDVELPSPGKVKITLQAAGGTLPLTVGDPTTELQSPTMEMQKDSQGNDMEEVMKYEVHRLFKVATTTMVNTNAAGGANRDAVSFEIDNPSSSSDIIVIANAIPIRVYKGGQWIELAKAVPVSGNATITASKVAVDGTFGWCAERVNITQDPRYQYASYKGNQKSRFELYLEGKLNAKWWDQNSVATD